jgi:peroxiredoxin
MPFLIKPFLTAFGLYLCFSFSLLADVSIGAPAPSFKLPNQNGDIIELDQFEGKTVILEWYNQDCPFVRKFYDAQKMQELQAKATSEGMIWLTIASSAPGKQGHLTQKSAQERIKAEGLKASHLLLDPEGKVGKGYGAKTTPHMFVISTKGNVLYDGAIDTVPSTNSNDIKKAENYVEMAMNDLKSSDTVKVAKTKPYGCSVKYP